MKLRYEDIPRRIRISDSSGLHCQWSDLDWWLTEGAVLTGLNDEPPDLSPDFQRGHVWTREQQVAYVEYRLSGGYGADLLLFNRVHDDARAVIVDGLQRLTAAREFMIDDFRVFRGVGGRDAGWWASEFPQVALRRINSGASFRVVVNDLSTRADVLRWYLELNAGGTPHADQEIARVHELYEVELRGGRHG